MKFGIFLIILLSLVIFPVYAQTTSNPTVSLETTEIPYDKFNVISSNANSIELEHEHAINWQINLENKLVYANPLGNAVVRFYDNLSKEKFIEIGMGSQPDYKFWVAAQTPETGYAMIYNKAQYGWTPEKQVIAAYTETTGLTINSGDRIVVSNLDIERFVIKDLSVYGMESSTDPPAVNSGSLVMKVVSGNPAANPLFYLPYILAISTAIIIVVLLKTKKRT